MSGGAKICEWCKHLALNQEQHYACGLFAKKKKPYTVKSRLPRVTLDDTCYAFLEGDNGLTNKDTRRV